jgi:hypothetical protein
MTAACTIEDCKLDSGSVLDDTAVLLLDVDVSEEDILALSVADGHSGLYASDENLTPAMGAPLNRLGLSKSVK